VTGAPGRRAERVAERIKAELMDLLVRGVVRDPSAADCYVTAVRMTDDLRNARVFVRMLRTDVSEEARKQAIDALTRATGFLRRELAPRLPLKHQPDLRFVWDEAAEKAARIEELLAEEQRRRGEDIS
jgi:ribosome-binding factor A